MFLRQNAIDCYGLERFGLTSLEELPPLDANVAARLAEEGADAAEPA